MSSNTVETKALPACKHGSHCKRTNPLHFTRWYHADRKVIVKVVVMKKLTCPYSGSCYLTDSHHLSSYKHPHRSSRVFACKKCNRTSMHRLAKDVIKGKVFWSCENCYIVIARR